MPTWKKGELLPSNPLLSLQLDCILVFVWISNFVLQYISNNVIVNKRDQRNPFCLWYVINIESSPQQINPARIKAEDKTHYLWCKILNDRKTTFMVPVQMRTFSRFNQKILHHQTGSYSKLCGFLAFMELPHVNKGL